MARRMFSRRQFLAAGHTDDELHWGVGRRWLRLAHGWYLMGTDPVTPEYAALDRD